MIYFFSGFIFILIILILAFFSSKINLIDIPDRRKSHVGKIPLVGGLAIYICSVLTLFIYEVSSILSIIIFSSFILVLVGAIDDSKGLGVKFRLIIQLIVCLIVVGFGIEIKSLGSIENFGDINLNYFSILFTVFCIIGLTNAFNFIDGIDGLCASQFLISLLSIIIFSYFLNKSFSFDDLNFLISISIYVSFFIIFNIFNFNKIFLGDAGSLFLGFFISCLLIIFSQNNYEIISPFLTIWCVTLPVLDIISVIIRRIKRKINPFHPDRLHIHHLLMRRGYSNYNTLIVLSVTSIFFNFMGFIIFLTYGLIFSNLLFIILILVYTILTSHLENN